jgi:hypothetical protein
MGSVEFIKSVLERHFLRRWRHGLIVQTPATNTQELGLDGEWERIGSMLYQAPPLALT